MPLTSNQQIANANQQIANQQVANQKVIDDFRAHGGQVGEIGRDGVVERFTAGSTRGRPSWCRRSPATRRRRHA